MPRSLRQHSSAIKTAVVCYNNLTFYKRENVVHRLCKIWGTMNCILVDTMYGNKVPIEWLIWIDQRRPLIH